MQGKEFEDWCEVCDQGCTKKRCVWIRKCISPFTHYKFQCSVCQMIALEEDGPYDMDNKTYTATMKSHPLKRPRGRQVGWRKVKQNG